MSDSTIDRALSRRPRMHSRLLRGAVLGLALGAAGATAAGASSATAATNYSAAIAGLEAQVPAMLAEDHVVGATVALVDGNRLVWSRGFGYADRERGVPVTDRTLFHVGSTTKTYAAAAIMQLVERGLVDLDAPLARYVPEFRLLPPSASRKITVRTVLDHHSGIPGDVFNGGFTYRAPYPGYTAWLIKALRTMYPERPINTEFAYNNSGFVLLGRVIENVSGLDLEQYMQRHVLRPAGMRTAHIDDALATSRELTRNYELVEGPGGAPATEPRPREYVNASTAGSLVASARDVAAYMSTMLADGRGANGRILRPSSVKRMWTVQNRLAIDAQTPLRLGLSWVLEDKDLAWAGPVRWHDGGTTWNFTAMKLLPESDLGVFVSVNTRTAGAPNHTIANAILGAAYTAKTGRPDLGPGVLPASTPVPLVTSAVAPYLGRYSGHISLSRVDLAGDATGVVWRRDLGTPRESAATFRPHTDGWYRSAEDPQTQIQFRTVNGRRLIVKRITGSNRLWPQVQAERMASAPVPQAWMARRGLYRAINGHPNGTPIDGGRALSLISVDGVMAMGPPEGEDGDVMPLRVANAGTAFTFGIFPGLGRDSGDVVRAWRAKSGRDHLSYMGLTYARIGD